MPSRVIRSGAGAPPLPSKTPPSAMKPAISSRQGPTQRRKSTPWWATAGPAPNAAMTKGAVPANRTAAVRPSTPESSTACRPMSPRASVPAPRVCAMWIAAAWRTA